jgi:peptidoglycan/LPS O-acetylase OafA/YrhL
MSHNPALSYRADIDGLRAVAVLAVVFYHFGIGGIAGGFVGVDVFFVISGFLITGIIQREIEQDRFTFAGFYERRIRRIFPALFVVLAATLLTGYFILLPSDLVLLGKSTLATLAFGSNVLFWRTSGYFDTTSELNPLLHTWSLAVEEQFYIGLPILLILVFRYAKSSLRPVLIAGILISLLACLWVQGLRPTAAFYLSPFRAWELLLGAYLAVGNLPLVTKSWMRESLAWLGLFLLVISIVFIKAGPEFPGWHALGPVLGTGLLIYAGGSGLTVVNSLLSVKPVVFIGLISYSLYLWHWPVLVFMNYLNGIEPLGMLALVGILVSIVLAVFSYCYVETPFRVNRMALNFKWLTIFTVSSSILLIILSSAILLTNGAPRRFNDDVAFLDSEIATDIKFSSCESIGLMNGKPNPNCMIGAKVPEKISVVIWGDSHALALAPAFDIAFKERGISALLVFDSACMPLLNLINEFNSSCHINNEKTFNYLASNKKIKLTILAATWISYSEKNGFYSVKSINGDYGNELVFPQAFDKTIAELDRKSKDIWVIGQIPWAPDHLRDLALRLAFNNPMPKETGTAEVIDRLNVFNNTVLKNRNNITFSNPTEVLCPNRSCVYLYEGKPIYRDASHLSLYGAIYIQPWLGSEFDKYYMDLIHHE